MPVRHATSLPLVATAHATANLAARTPLCFAKRATCFAVSALSEERFFFRDRELGGSVFGERHNLPRPTDFFHFRHRRAMSMWERGAVSFVPP